MPTGDPIITCTNCGKSYYLNAGHQCKDKTKTYPDSPCLNCEHLRIGQPVKVNQFGVCVICGKEVPAEVDTLSVWEYDSSPEAEGRKNDSGKLRFELLPPEAIEQIVNVLTKGAEKYSQRNWEKGISYGRVYGALQRHLNEFWKGNDIDPEWGVHHLAHAGCCLLFLLTYELRGMKKWDDRPRPPFDIQDLLRASFHEKEE